MDQQLPIPSARALDRRRAPRLGRMHRVILTGGPGAGKTTLLGELARLGHRVVEESARAIIAERLASGESPRPGLLDFAREILRRDVEKFERAASGPGWVFFDRGAVEALGMVYEAAPLPKGELRDLLSKYRFNDNVFVLPPWPDIYANDAQRDQSFEESVRVHAAVVAWYTACGYQIHEVPRDAVALRARHILGVLGASGNRRRARR